MSYLRINYVAIQLCKDTLPNPASIYVFKVMNRNTRKRPDICSKLTMKIPERRHWGSSGVFIINFELFQIFLWFYYCWFWTSKYLQRKLSDILYLRYLFYCVYWRKAGLNKKQCREFRYFSYFTHSVRCNFCKPSIAEIIHSGNTGKFV